MTLPTTEPTFFGATIATTIDTTAHKWVADQDGLFHTATDLNAEWQAAYDKMIAGSADTMSFIARLEGNAQAVFQNTGLNALSAEEQKADREDVQRVLDSVGLAMKKAGVSGTTPLTTVDYLKIGYALQGSPILQELAQQGYGLYAAAEPKYSGYVNDFRWADGSTLYIGGGLDNNENALDRFFGDVLLPNLIFPAAAQDGYLVQLDYNGSAWGSAALPDIVGALDQFGFGRVLTAADFSDTPGSASSAPAAPPPAPAAPPPSGQMYSQLTGMLVPTTITANSHTWIANEDGLYLTEADLATEWQGYYQQMLAGNGASLTGLQRLEGNAEAVFENTDIAKVAQMDATAVAYYRMDVQREIDAIAATMSSLKYSPSVRLNTQTYLAIQHALIANPAMQELAVQGHGLNNPISPIYDGYTNDFQNDVDDRTLYLGPGQDTGERALRDFFDDAILPHLPFPTIARDGEMVQLNQNANEESTLQQAVDALNMAMFTRTLTAADFGKPGAPVAGTTVPAGKILSYFGNIISNTATLNGHVWTVGSDGRFHTTADLQTEWKTYYRLMLAGRGSALTAVQRLIGNAEAVFENTALADTRRFSAAKQKAYREDAQREFDVIAAAMATLKLGKTLLTEQDYLAIGQAIQSNAIWQELGMQGHGLNDAPSPKYYGYTHDFQNNSDWETYYVGGGPSNGEHAVADFFDDVILSHLPFPVVWQWNGLTQLNQNGNAEDDLDEAVAATNDAMFRRVYVAGDFSKNPNATGPVMWVSPAMATATPPPAPVPGPGQMLSLTGQVIPTTMVVNGNTWTADADGRYQTTTDLALAWYRSYQTALAGGTLTLTQRWQAQAEAVFLNTCLSKASEADQAVFRADVQREIDAVVTAMASFGVTGGPLGIGTYLRTEHALQGNAALEELALQGHGLNNPPSSRYDGYTNDFQWASYGTLYVGSGLNNGEQAVADMFDDVIMTHLPFATIAQDYEIVQLNQNGNEESTLAAAVAQFNQVLTGPLLTAANFLVPGKMPAAPAPAGLSSTTGFFGDTLPGSTGVNGHTWTLNADGLYVTTANLEIEWRGYYQTMLAGKGDTLTATQRLEGNAEAVFENTSISERWAPEEAQARMDVQRAIDAIAGAMAIDKTTYGIDPSQPLTEASYIRLGETLRANPLLEELALQGHGVWNQSEIYYGAKAHLGWLWSDTLFVGGGAGNGQNAIDYLLDSIVTNLPFATTWHNGAWMQFDSDGDPLMTAQAAATLFNTSAYRQVYVRSDFDLSASAVGAVVTVPGSVAPDAVPITSMSPTPGKVLTLDGSQIANTMTLNGHVWTADSNGLFHTTSLAAEWQTLGQKVLAGQTAGLTPWQILEGNAAIVFQNTGLSTLAGTALQAAQEDVQRVIDAEVGAAAINATTLGIPSNATLVHGSYLALERTLQSSPVLRELALQGVGLNNPPSARYSGFLNSYTAAQPTTWYVGPGPNNWQNALSVYMMENIIMETAFPTVWKWGQFLQLDQNGEWVMSLDDAVAVAAASTTVPLTAAQFRR
ncbi:MAG: hypothetical protein JSS43_29100 [Proteobacteria bacterium]|nr:hypothetical protein [Pseudomonadota bacterium]